MMKKIMTAFLLIACSATYGQQQTFRPVYTYTADLNNDGLPDTITLSSSLSNPGLFNKISITLSHFGQQSFMAAKGWANVDWTFLSKSPNQLRTNKLFLAKGPHQSVILLFGQLDGGDFRGDFSIINIEDNKIKMVFNQKDRNTDVEVPAKITDLGGDGRLDFVYKQYGETLGHVDSLNADIGTYTPFYVYTIDNDCVLNKELTMQYNKVHYVYAGLDSLDKIKVLYPRNGGKPKVVQ